MFPAIIFILITAASCLYPEVAAEKHIIHGISATEIKSEHYPASYPINTNDSWEWSVPTGFWGVVFKDFDLEVGTEGSGCGDWLEVGDRQRYMLTYTAWDRRVQDFISKGPQLILRFVSDGESEPNRRGFHLLVIYGANEHELRMNIHDATKTTKVAEKESAINSTTILIIIPAALVVYVVVISFGVVLLVRKRRRSKPTEMESRNIFGVRRNSGICHSRRTASTSDEHQSDAPSIQQQPSRTDRQVQRSNSQRSWMSRAELTNTLQNFGNASRKNDYTITHASRCRSPTSPPPASRSACQTLTKFFAAGTQRVRNRLSRSSDNDEYSETVDSLELSPVITETHSQECCPPSYEESYLVPVPPHADSQCYENLISSVCANKPYHGNQTNIYINAGAASGSRFSVNEITFDATKCIITSTFCDQQEEGARCEKFYDMEAHKSAVISSKKRNPKTVHSVMPSSSCVHIIDGYAFIVPVFDEDGKCENYDPPPGYDGSQISTISTGCVNIDNTALVEETLCRNDEEAYSNIFRQNCSNTQDQVE